MSFEPKIIIIKALESTINKTSLCKTPTHDIQYYQNQWLSVDMIL